MSLRNLFALALVALFACGRDPVDQARGFGQTSSPGLSIVSVDGTNVTGTGRTTAPIKLTGGTGNTGQMTTNSNGIKIPTVSGTLLNGEVIAYAGNPNGLISADAGSMCLDYSTPAIWQNTTGGTVWTKFVTGTLTTQTVGVFGDASDGSRTLDGSTTILGMVPTSNVYQMSRDLYFDNLTINSSVVLDTQNFRVFVRGTLALGSGSKISSDGQAGRNSVSQPFPLSGGSSVSSLPNTGTGGGIGDLPSPAAGGSSNNQNGAGTAGANASNMMQGFNASGGAGGSGTTTAGGAGGVTSSHYSANQGDMRSFPYCVTGKQSSGSSSPTVTGPGGGGGGGVVGQAGGSGGAGGGYLVVVARLWSGTGTLTANGGAGGTSTTGGGGGGGGGGGVAVFITNSTSAPTVTANGGAGGTSPTNTGGAGTAGLVLSYTAF